MLMKSSVQIWNFRMFRATFGPSCLHSNYFAGLANFILYSQYFRRGFQLVQIHAAIDWEVQSIQFGIRIKQRAMVLWLFAQAYPLNFTPLCGSSSHSIWKWKKQRDIFQSNISRHIANGLKMEHNYVWDIDEYMFVFITLISHVRVHSIAIEIVVVFSSRFANLC